MHTFLYYSQAALSRSSEYSLFLYIDPRLSTYVKYSQLYKAGKSALQCPIREGFPLMPGRATVILTVQPVTSTPGLTLPHDDLRTVKQCDFDICGWYCRDACLSASLRVTLATL